MASLSPYQSNVATHQREGYSNTEEVRDPREGGNMLARLQVASELITALQRRLTMLADRIYESGQATETGIPPKHCSLLRFPDDIIADAKCADAQINRIEGALGV